MKVTLLYPDREWGKDKFYFDREEIIKDLNLHILFRAAASLYDEAAEAGKTVQVAQERNHEIMAMMQRVMLTPLKTPEEVHYRQQMVKEAISNYDRMDEFYCRIKAAVDDINKYAMAKKKQGYGSGTDMGRRNVANIEYLERIVYHLSRVSETLQNWSFRFVTPEMQAFKDAFFDEYSSDFMICLEKVVKDLRSSLLDGIIDVQASLGPGLYMSSMTLTDIWVSNKINLSFLKTAVDRFGKYCKQLFTVEELVFEGENQNLLQDIGDIKNAALGGIMRHFEGFLEEQAVFFQKLHSQAAFLMGAANLYRRMKRMNVDICFPEITDRKDIRFEGLVELSLAINTLRCPVDNSLCANDKHLLVVTGANQGGKSTYLRSIGIAQIMLQCGMFVPAKSFASGLYSRVFTHFTRREDSAMNSGRLDEELGRMERIIDNLTKDSVLFLNESFATTTEKEGSIIAEDITTALYERGIRVMMVTHLLAFAQSCYAKQPEHAIFLSAERKEDGERTFRMIEQEPELTSYGLDLYDSVLRKNH